MTCSHVNDGSLFLSVPAKQEPPLHEQNTSAKRMKHARTARGFANETEVAANSPKGRIRCTMNYISEADEVRIL